MTTVLTRSAVAAQTISTVLSPGRRTTLARGDVAVTSGEYLGEFRNPAWLDQVTLEPRFASPTPSRVFTGSGQGNQAQVLQPRMLGESPGEIIAADIWQLEVDQNNRRCKRHRNSESGLT